MQVMLIRLPSLRLPRWKPVSAQCLNSMTSAGTVNALTEAAMYWCQNKQDGIPQALRIR